MRNRRTLAAMVLGLATLTTSPSMSWAETVFTNENATASQARPAVATQFELAKPMTITSVRVMQVQKNKQMPPGLVRLYSNGKLLYKGQATAADGKYWVIQPNLVFPAGRYTINTSTADTWSSNAASGNAGMATVMADPLASADLAVANEYFGLTSRPVNAADMRKQLDNLKMRIDAQASGLSTTATKKGALSDLKREHESRTANESDSNGGMKRPLDGIQNNNITPGKYTDTFGGERINRGRSGDSRDFRGSTSGYASDGDETAGNTESDDLNNDIAAMLTDIGGKTSGDAQANAEELAYAMSVGSDGWEATKNMSKTEREEYWTAERNRQLGGSASRPREDQESYGSFRPFGSKAMRDAQRRFVDRAISARRGAAGGGTQSQSGGPVRFPTGADDRPERERSAGTLNWDRILFINTQINPTRQ